MCSMTIPYLYLGLLLLVRFFFLILNVIKILTVMFIGGATSPANPAYTPNELAYQLEMTKARIIVAHPTNVESALAAADLVGLPKSNVFVFGDKAVSGCLPYKQVFLTSERKASIIKMTAEEANDTVAFLCFSSGTTGRENESRMFKCTLYRPSNLNFCWIKCSSSFQAKVRVL